MASLSNTDATHPPRSNPPLRSSSAPPSPCITPSTVTCVTVVSFMVQSLLANERESVRSTIPRQDERRNLTTASGLAVEPICAVLSRPIRVQSAGGILHQPGRRRTAQRRDLRTAARRYPRRPTTARRALAAVAPARPEAERFS